MAPVRVAETEQSVSFCFLVFNHQYLIHWTI
jgi:hypothetical protein